MLKTKLKNIERTGWNPRDINPKSDRVQKMMESMKTAGLIIPLIVRKKPKSKDKFELADGDLRLTAAEQLGWTDIEIEVRELSDLIIMEIMLITAVDKNQLNPLEEAKGIKQLLEKGRSQDQVAEMVGKSQGWISNRLRLLEAPDILKEWLLDGLFTPKHVFAMLSFKAVGHESAYKDTLKDIKGIFEADRAISVLEITEIFDDNMDGLEQAGKLPYYFDIGDCESLYKKDYEKEYDVDHCKTKCKKILAWNNKKYCPDKKCQTKLVMTAYKIAKKKLEDKAEKAESKNKTPKNASKGIKDLKEMITNNPDTKVEDLDTSKVMRSEYESMGLAAFEKTECKTCCLQIKNKKKEQICINPPCFNKKLKEAVRLENNKVIEANRRVRETIDHFFHNNVTFLDCFCPPLEPQDEQLLRDTIEYIICELGEYNNSAASNARLPIQRYTRKYVDKGDQYHRHLNDLSVFDLMRVLVETITWMKMDKDWSKGLYEQKELKKTSPYINDHWTKTTSNTQIEKAGGRVDLPVCIFCLTAPVLIKDQDKMTHVYCPECELGITPVSNMGTAKKHWRQTYENASWFNGKSLQAYQKTGKGTSCPSKEKDPQTPKEKKTKGARTPKKGGPPSGDEESVEINTRDEYKNGSLKPTTISEQKEMEVDPKQFSKWVHFSREDSNIPICVSPEQIAAQPVDFKYKINGSLKKITCPVCRQALEAVISTDGQEGFHQCDIKHPHPKGHHCGICNKKFTDVTAKCPGPKEEKIIEHCLDFFTSSRGSLCGKENNNDGKGIITSTATMNTFNCPDCERIYNSYLHIVDWNNQESIPEESLCGNFRMMGSFKNYVELTTFLSGKKADKKIMEEFGKAKAMTVCPLCKKAATPDVPQVAKKIRATKGTKEALK